MKKSEISRLSSHSRYLRESALNIFSEKGVIRVEEENFRLPADVRGTETSVLKLSISRVRGGGACHHNVMHDLAFYKYVTCDLPFRFA